MSQPDPDLLLDVSDASAAYLLTLLPEIVQLPKRDAFERLSVHFEAAVRAYLDGLRGWESEHAAGSEAAAAGR